MPDIPSAGVYVDIPLGPAGLGLQYNVSTFNQLCHIKILFWSVAIVSLPSLYSIYMLYITYCILTLLMSNAVGLVQEMEPVSSWNHSVF